MKQVKVFLIIGLFSFISSSLYAQGIVKGTVTFDGVVPPAEKVEVKSDVPTCGTSKEVGKIVLGTNQGVTNAVVKILGAKGTAEMKKARLDQIHCEFQPHVQAVPLGSTLYITSSDSVLHNSHGFYEDGSTAFNIAVPIVGMELSKKLDKAGIIKLRCDAGHTWMKGYIVVVDEPYYAVTDTNGNFTIQGVPAGNYELEVWQEWLGKKSQSIVVREGETEPVTVTLKESK